MTNYTNIGEKLLTGLDSPYLNTYEYIKNGNRIFTQSLSLLIEYYMSSAKGPTSGTKNHTIKLLYGRCINDLVVGFHLAYHAYVNQYYSVTRPIFETLDLIELFQKDERMAKLWSDDSKKFKKGNYPADIRKKLGRPRYDPIYSLFCEFGSHPTFVGTKSNAYLVKKETDEKTSMMITLGPTDLFKPAILPFAFSYILLLKISFSIVGYFSKESKLDSRHLLKSIVEHYKEFTEKCILEGFSFYKIDITPIQDVIKQTDLMLETLNEKIVQTSI